MQLIFKNKKIKIQHDPLEKILLLEYFGVFNKQLILEAYSHIKLNELNAIVADLSQLTGSFIKLVNDFDLKYQQLKQVGLQRQAIIISDDLIINNLVDKLEKKIVASGIEAFVTTSKEEAYKWIKNQ